jgi:4-hydroxybenzoate polyprenyltransferase
MTRRVRYCWAEARPQVQLIFLLRFSAGALLAGDGRAPGRRAVLGALGWVAATLSVYLLNGVADRVEDVANASRRPIARGDLPAGFAIGAVVVSAAAAIGAAWSAGPGPGAAVLAFLVVGYAYSGPPFPLKRSCLTATAGGAALGLLTYLGGALCVSRHVNAELAVYAVAMSAWMGAVGGIAKDLSDVAGDRLAGRWSWPVALGERGARELLRLTAGAVAVCFAAGAVAYGPGLLGSVAVVWFGAAAVAAASGSAEDGRRAPDGADRARRRLPYRRFMWTQIASHTVLFGTMAAVVLA